MRARGGRAADPSCTWAPRRLHHAFARAAAAARGPLCHFLPSPAATHPRSKAYTPPERYGSNIDAMIAAGKAAGVRHWLLITPPPVYEVPGKTVRPRRAHTNTRVLKGGGPPAAQARRGRRAHPRVPLDTHILSPPPAPLQQGARSSANTRLYVDQLHALGRKHDAAVLDIFSGWGAVAGWADKWLQADRLHLNAEGNAKLFSDVMATIKVRAPRARAHALRAAPQTSGAPAHPPLQPRPSLPSPPPVRAFLTPPSPRSPRWTPPRWRGSSPQWTRSTGRTPAPPLRPWRGDGAGDAAAEEPAARVACCW